MSWFSRYPARPIAVIFLQGACSLRCPFCATETRVETLPPDALAGLLDRLAEAEVQNVVLGGGEPAEWPWGWETACRMARERGFLVQLGTAGAALRPGFEQVAWVDRFVLPLDGDTPARHNRFRPMGLEPAISMRRARAFFGRLGGTGVPDGHFAVIMDRLAALAEAGREVTLSTVVTRESLPVIDRLTGMVEQIARCLPVHAWHLYRVIPAGRGGGNTAERFGINREAFDLEVARIRGRISAVRVFKRTDMRFSRDVDFFWLEKGLIRRGLEVWSACDAAVGSDPDWLALHETAVRPDCWSGRT